MKLIVGLGNPGEQYAQTRHNVGFWVVDRLAGTSAWQADKYANGLSAKIELSCESGELLKPQTFMNNSGTSVAYAVNKHAISSADLLVIHDDLDVPLGEAQLKLGGGAAGHNGVASVVYHLETPEFWRLRVGIGPHLPELIAQRTANTSDFVLSPFHPDERPVVDQVIDMVCSRLTEVLPDNILPSTWSVRLHPSSDFAA